MATYEEAKTGGAAMTSSLMTPKVQPVALRSWIACILFGFVAAAGIWVFVSALIKAPAARAMIERRNAEEIAQENRAFCTKFGMAPDTPAFSACANELAYIRQRQEDRWKRDFDLF